MHDFFNHIIRKAFGRTDPDLKYQNVGGGCINNTAKITAHGDEYFVKWNSRQLDMFEKEQRGLQLLHGKSALNIPKTFDTGEIEGKGYLLMEYVTPGSSTKAFWEELGTGLAQLHRNTDQKFGLAYNNYIGRLEQINTECEQWSEFFINYRLNTQIAMARNSGLIDSAIIRQFDALSNKFGDLFTNEPPSLLHGDLWSGNYHCGQGNSAYVIDPAVYYGHREAELSFTRLFGGFDRTFYESYNSAYPLEPGFEDRIDLFNLYPLLVHVNLFGSSYLGGIMRTLNKFAG